MTDQPDIAEGEEAPPKKKSKMLLIALILVPVLGGGAFFGVYSGMIPLPFGSEPVPAEDGAHGDGENHADDGHGAEEERLPVSQVAFVPLDEMVISLAPGATSKHLKLRLSIEVTPESMNDVTAVTPRIVDVLNTFLRAVDSEDFEVPRSMLRLRAQMLRRVQLVTPKGSVRDILIQEFVLN